MQENETNKFSFLLTVWPSAKVKAIEEYKLVEVNDANKHGRERERERERERQRDRDRERQRQRQREKSCKFSTLKILPHKADGHNWLHWSICYWYGLKISLQNINCKFTQILHTHKALTFLNNSLVKYHGYHVRQTDISSVYQISLHFFCTLWLKVRITETTIRLHSADSFISPTMHSKEIVTTNESENLEAIPRVSDQNGISLQWYIVEIYHSGQKPLICNYSYTT